MSRLDWDDLWEHHFGKSSAVNCPSCGEWTIHKSPRGKYRDWIRGHIIHHRNHGPDIYENVRPICTTCNSRDKSYDSNYHYMAIALGRMTVEEADMGVKMIWDMFERQRMNLDMVRCLGEVQSTGQACDKKRKPHSYFCKVHGRKADQQLRRYQIRLLTLELDRLWQRYYDSAVINDNDLIDDLADSIDNIHDRIDSLQK